MAKCLTFSKYAITICETKLFIFLLSGGERDALQVGMRQEVKVWKGQFGKLKKIPTKNTHKASSATVS